MSIDNLTFGDLKMIYELFSGSDASKLNHGAVGKTCIVRGYASGVHLGEVVSVTSNGMYSRCELKNARRLWKWYGGLSLSDIAKHGIVQKNSRISCLEPQKYIEDVVEFIPATDLAIKSIMKAKEDESGR